MFISFHSKGGWYGMDILTTILLYAFLYGLFGWCAMPLTHFLGWS
jgi:hypothetical protein